MLTAQKALIVAWTDGVAGGKCRWSLRGIHPDGRFYGCATFYDENRTANLAGKLSPDDVARVWSLASDIRSQTSAERESESAGACDGLLAEGLYGSPTVIYRHRSGDDCCSPLARDFHSLTALLRRYAETACQG